MITYKIIKVDDEGNETLVNSSSVDMGAVGAVFDMLKDKARAAVKEFSSDLALTSEDSAVFASNTLNNVITQSMGSVELGKRVQIQEIQRQYNAVTLNNRIEAVRIDKETKEQRLLTEQLKNGQVSFIYTFYKAYYDADGNFTQTTQTTGDEITVDGARFPLFTDYGNLASKEISTQPMISTVELANKKMQEDINYVRTQAENLDRSVVANNKKIGADLMKDVVGSISMGGMKAPESSYKAILKVADNISYGLMQEDGTLNFNVEDITKVT